MPDARTIATYDTKASDYAARFENDGPDTTLQAFIDLIPKGGRVLDLGCGPGMASAMMRDAGLDPDPLDASQGMVTLARDRYGLSARTGSFDDVSGTAIYDGVWANFSLLHAPHHDLPRHFAAIGRALKPGGILHVGMKTGTGSRRDAIDRLYTLVSVAELRQLFRDAGLAVIHAHEGADTGLAGTVDAFVIMRGRKDG